MSREEQAARSGSYYGARADYSQYVQRAVLEYPARELAAEQGAEAPRIAGLPLGAVAVAAALQAPGYAYPHLPVVVPGLARVSVLAARLAARAFRTYVQGRAWALRHRALAAGGALLIAFSVTTPVVTQLISHRQYHLSAATRSLIGPANPNLASKLTYDASKDSYIFNQAGLDAAPATSKDPNDPGAVLKQLQAQTGGSGKQDNSLYSVELPKDSSKGITYHDNNLGLSFSVVPDFAQGAGQQTDDRLVYPAPHGGLAVYTAKSNGLKEDFVLPKPVVGNQLSFTYTLKLPKELEAKLLDTGALGIYSADPSFFGNISYGSTADEQRVMQARLNGDKTNLVFALPAPTIKVHGKQQGTARADFFLDGTTLTVKVANLHSIPSSSYPLSIDPSVVITSSSDFSSGNNEDNIDFSTADQINRGGLTGGSMGSWSSAGTAFTTARYGQASVVWNNYLYVIGGCTTTNSSCAAIGDVQYALLTATGNLASDAGCGATWCTTTALPAVVAFARAEAYNGYLYLVGGCTLQASQCQAIQSSVQYAKLLSTGALASDAGCGATWCTTTSMPSVNNMFAMVVNNGYLYVMGGCTVSASTCGNSQVVNATYYAPFNADGTLGSWTATTALPTAAYSFDAVVYNNYVYIAGGATASFWKTTLATVYYAPLAATGGIGTWVAATSLPSARQGLGLSVNGGYLYAIGGSTNGNNTSLTDALFSPIMANGSLGSWTASSTYSNARFQLSAQAANGYVYLLGGTQSATVYNDIQYAKVDPVGATSSWNTTAIPYTTYYQTAVVWNGTICQLGGTNGTTENGFAYCASINSDGTVGSWSSNTSFAATAQATSVAYNGYVYEIGGYTSAPTASVSYALICTGSNSGVGGCTTNKGAGTWSSATPLPVAIDNATSVVANGYIYEIGGSTGSGSSLTSVYYALICTGSNSGVDGCGGTAGALGTTWHAATSLPVGLQNSTSVTWGGYIYEIAGGTGTGGTTWTGSVYYALICTGSNSGVDGCGSTAGALGTTWHTTTSLPVTNMQGEAVVSNGVIYELGGCNAGSCTNPSAAVYFSSINADGSIGPWNSRQGMPSGIRTSAAVAYNGFIYQFTGCNSGGLCPTSSAYYTRLNNGGSGTTGSWTATSSFSTARYNQTSVAYNGYLYIVGGSNGLALNDVQYAPINSNGTLGAWHYTHNSTDDGTTFVAGFTTARNGHTSVAYNGYLYVIGGSNGGYLNDVQYAPLNSNGTVGAWSSTASFMNGRINHTSVVYKGYLYVIGGLASTGYVNDVQYAPINSNGTLGAWHYTHNSTDDGTTFVAGFTSARYLHSSIVANGYVYVVGGYNGSPLNDVQYAPLNANGTIGSWSPTSNLPTARYGVDTVAYDGYLYMLGGYDGSNYLTDAQYTTLNANGTIGAWTPTVSFTTGRYGATSVAYQGYLYLLGGLGSAGYLSDVQYSPLNSIPRIAHYSKLIDFGTTAGLSSISYGGNLSGGLHSIAYRTADATGVFGTTATADTLGSGAGGTCSGSGSTRYVWVYVTLDDSQTGAVFPDAQATSTANLTDLTVSYTTGSHPPPNLRMHGGKYFNNNVLQPLDTCGA